MFADDSIDGVVCYTGGWGSPRVLPYLDYELIRRKPKVLTGYSDITALLNAVHKKTGLVTFHGPVGGSTFEPYTLENFRRVIMTAETPGLLAPPSKKPNELVDRTNRILKLTRGKATGPLATFDGEVLRPEGPVTLEPNTRVRVTIETTAADETGSRSFLRIAQGLNLDGPADWSERLEDYLYGEAESRG